MTTSMFFLLILAFLAANLPFMSNRFLLFKHVKRKLFGYHLIELVILYCLVGLLSRMLEGQRGVVHSQDWQFYVTTICLFTVFAFPGFVVRFFWKGHV